MIVEPDTDSLIFTGSIIFVLHGCNFGALAAIVYTENHLIIYKCGQCRSVF